MSTSVSIIIITCNRQKELKRLLESLKSQILTPREIIIINTGGGHLALVTDDSKDSLPIKYFYETGLNIPSARNKGISLARSSIIAFLDDDCEALPGWIEAIADSFSSRHDIMALQGNTTHVSSRSKIYAGIMDNEYNAWIGSMLETTPGHVDMLNTQNFAIRKEILDSFRKPFDERLITNEDVELHWKLKKKGILIAYSEKMRARHYYRDRLVPFLRAWYFYGFGKAQVKAIHNDFYDYHLDSVGSFYKAVRVFYKDINASYRRAYAKRIYSEKGFCDLMKYYSALVLQRVFFIAGLVAGKGWKASSGEGFKKSRDMVLFITNRCNLDCSHCFNHNTDRKDKSDMKAGDIIKVLRSLDRDIRTVCIGGGEPFLSNELEEICEALAKNIYLSNMYIVSNGLETDLILNKVKRILKTSYFTFNLWISLDGLAETHDRVRNHPGAFRSAVKTINALKVLEGKNNNLEVDVQTAISKNNLDDLIPLADFVRKELRVFHVFDIVRDKNMFCEEKRFINQYYGPKDSSQLLETGQIKRLKRNLDKLYNIQVRDGIIGREKAGYQKRMFKIISSQVIQKKPAIRCSAGESIVTIFPNYDISICEAVKPITNLKNYGFDVRKAVQENFTDEIREFRDRCYCTNPCYISSSLNQYDNGKI